MRPATLDGVRAKALIALAGVLQITCNQAILNAPTGSTLVLVVNPPFIEAHGGVATVSAVVTEVIGTPVADGTVVQFFSDLGRIDEQGKTNDGVARVNFVSDARSGTANITAISGPATATATISVGSIRPALVVVTAAPRRILDSRSSQIVAVVLDEFGNPIPNVPVFFTVDGATEFMDSGGQAVFTDNDGRARDVLRTRYGRELVGRVVTVTARTANDVTGETEVLIN